MFDQASLGDLTDYLLPNWLRVAVIDTNSPYSYGNGREILYEFNHSTLFTDFFQQCPIDYLRRELADFPEAGIGLDGV